MIYTAHEVAALFILALLLGTIIGYLAGYDHAESHALKRRDAERRHKYKTDNNNKDKPR